MRTSRTLICWLAATTLVLCSGVTALAQEPSGPRREGEGNPQAGPVVSTEEAEDLEPLVTDRPDATESAETVPRGLFQLESGYTYTRLEQLKQHSVGELLLRVGVAGRVELRFGFNSYLHHVATLASDSGLEDSSLGLKFKLIDGGSGMGLAHPTIAVLVSTTLPTGNSAVTSSAVQPELRLAVGWDLTDRVSMGTNLGYAYLNDVLVDERFNAIGATFTVGYGLTERIGTYLEYFGEYGIIQDGPRDHYVNGGTTFLINANTQLDARIGYGLNGLDDDFFVGFGTAVRW